MSEWHKDLGFAKKMIPMINEIYKEVFDPQSIVRLSDGETHFLDKFFSIDGWVELKQGCILTFQEKMRRYHIYTRYRDLTMEIFSNKPQDIKGDWFHIAADLYFCGYSNKEETMIIDYHIVKLLPLKLWIAKNWDKSEIRENIKHSKATFLILPWHKIPKEFILKEAINYDREKFRGTMGGVKGKAH